MALVPLPFRIHLTDNAGLITQPWLRALQQMQGAIGTSSGGGGGSTPPGGANTQVQFNDSGVFDGSSTFTYNKTTGLLSVGSLAVAGTAVPTSVSLQQASAIIGSGSTGSTSISVGFNPAITAFSHGMLLAVRASTANTVSNPTFSPDSLAAKTITKGNNQPLAIGDIAGSGHWLLLQYNADLNTWCLLNPASLLSTSSGGVGYTTGAGGTVTQLTSKSTAVTLNKPCGQITLNGAALAANTTVTFSLNNSTIAAGDMVYVSRVQGGAVSGSYNIWADLVGTGAVNISVRNITASSLSEAIVVGFYVLKGATA